MMPVQLLLILASFLSLVSTLTNHPRCQGQDVAPAEAHLIHQFPNPTWVENIAIRKTGQLLLTVITSPSLFLVDPTTSALNPTSSSTATLIHSFSPELSVLGIAETTPDNFYVIVGNISLSPLNPGLGTYTVFSVNLQSYNSTFNTGSVIKEVTALTQASLLNGMSTLSTSQGLLLAADSVKGALWLVDTTSSTYSLLLQEPEMAPPNSPGLVLGINGVHVLPLSSNEDIVYIYFDNQGTSTFYRLLFSLSKMQKIGNVEIVKGNVTVDDFALDVEGGVAYLAGSADNALLRVGIDGGEVEILYGGLNETALPGPTSVAIGRGSGGGKGGTVYVTTNGGLLAPVNGNFTEGGKVVAVDVDC
jgi:hypothetical protein